MGARLSTALCLCAFVWQVIAVADEAAAAQPPQTADDQVASQDEPEPPTLSVALTVYGRELDSTQQSVTVIDRRAIEDSGAGTVGELLRYAMGLHVLSGGARGGFNAVQIRGGDPNFTVVLLDGVPLNDSTDTFGGSVNVAMLPTAGVDKVEVVRGPMSFFYGSAPLSGVINIVTRRGEPGKPTARAEVEAGGASVVRGGASFSGGTDPIGYALSAQWESEQGRIADDQFRQFNTTGSVSVLFDETAELVVNGRAAMSDVDDYPEASGGPTFGSGELRTSIVGDVSVGSQLLLGRAGERQHKLSATVSHRRLDRDSPGVQPVVPPATEVTRYTRLRAGGATDIHPGRAFRLVSGVDVDHEIGDNESILISPPPPLFGGPTSGDYRLVRTTTGAYLEAALRAPHLLIETGVRLDATEHLSAQWSPRLGISYRPKGGPTRLRGSLGRGFKLPIFFALASPPVLGGNPDLDPETSRGGDIGVEHRIEALHVVADVSFFYYRYKNLIDFNFDTFRLENRTAVESRGVEVALTWDRGEAVATHANVTWNTVDNLTTGARLLHRPEWTGSVRLDWRPTARVRTSLDVQFVSENLDLQIPVPDRSSVEGYALLGAAGSWRVAERWEIVGRVDNLAAQEYETLIGFPGPGPLGRIGVRFMLR